MSVERSFYELRRHEDCPKESAADPRTAFEHDRDRLLYSSAFRRLAGITQVAAVREQHLLHNRLTHSLKVGQIGRRLAQRLLRDDRKFNGGIKPCKSLPDIVEAAGLAHDIGHPPFGHAVEKVLDQRMKSYGGFEGNAQSFRVVTKLAVRDESYDGLDLTRATLNAILKYPCYREDARDTNEAPWHDRRYGRKWGAYRSEKLDFTFARESEGRGDESSVTACGGGCNDMRSVAAMLMDWADDISYVTHDVYDYFRAGLMPLSKIEEREDDFLNYAKRCVRGEKASFKEFESAYRKIKSGLPASAWHDTRGDRVQLYQWMNEMITRFMGAVEIESSSMVHVKKEEQYQADVLKKLTHFYVIEKPTMGLAQEGQMKIIADLFDELLRLHGRKGDSRGSRRWPMLLQEFYVRMKKDTSGYSYRDKNERCNRAICDYICTLTENQAIDLYQRMTGNNVSEGSIFGAWFA